MKIATYSGLSESVQKPKWADVVIKVPSSTDFKSILASITHLDDDVLILKNTCDIIDEDAVRRFFSSFKVFTKVKNGNDVVGYFVPREAMYDIMRYGDVDTKLSVTHYAIKC